MCGAARTRAAGCSLLLPCGHVTGTASPRLDVGAGTGCVGAALSTAGFRRVAGTDLEPARWARRTGGQTDVSTSAISCGERIPRCTRYITSYSPGTSYGPGTRTARGSQAARSTWVLRPSPSSARRPGSHRRPAAQPRRPLHHQHPPATSYVHGQRGLRQKVCSRCRAHGQPLIARATLGRTASTLSSPASRSPLGLNDLPIPLDMFSAADLRFDPVVRYRKLSACAVASGSASYKGAARHGRGKRKAVAEVKTRVAVGERA